MLGAFAEPDHWTTEATSKGESKRFIISIDIIYRWFLETEREEPGLTALRSFRNINSYHLDGHRLWFLATTECY
jgi:hypothetical protein